MQSVNGVTDASPAALLPSASQLSFLEPTRNRRHFTHLLDCPGGEISRAGGTLTAELAPASIRMNLPSDGVSAILAAPAAAAGPALASDPDGAPRPARRPPFGTHALEVVSSPLVDTSCASTTTGGRRLPL